MNTNATKILGGQEEKRKLPAGWRWVRLKETGVFEAGGTPAKERIDYWNGEIPFVTGADITELRITKANARAFLTRDGLSSGKTVICEAGTVVIVTRTRVGRSGIAQETMGASQDITAFKCGPEIHQEFLCRYLHNISEHLIENCRGATIQGLSREFVDNLVIPLPPLSEQQRIAGVLREQMVVVEKARMAAQARLAAVKALPAAFLRQVFPQPGQPLPAGWRWVKLGEVCEIKGGKRLPAGTDFVSDCTPHPYMRVVDFKGGTVDICNLRYLDKTTQSTISRYTIGKDDVYISIAGSIGIVGTIPDSLDGANLTENAAKLVICDKNDLSRDYLARFLMSSTGQNFISERTNTVGQPKLALTRIATIPIPIPPLFEQRQVAGMLKEQMAMVEKARAAAEAELATINALPAALLRRAFAGEL